jgi:hypothetical protein
VPDVVRRGGTVLRDIVVVYEVVVRIFAARPLENDLSATFGCVTAKSRSGGRFMFCLPIERQALARLAVRTSSLVLGRFLFLFH